MKELTYHNLYTAQFTYQEARDIALLLNGILIEYRETPENDKYKMAKKYEEFFSKMID